MEMKVNLNVDLINTEILIVVVVVVEGKLNGETDLSLLIVVIKNVWIIVVIQND